MTALLWMAAAVIGKMMNFVYRFSSLRLNSIFKTQFIQVFNFNFNSPMLIMVEIQVNANPKLLNLQKKCRKCLPNFFIKFAWVVDKLTD